MTAPADDWRPERLEPAAMAYYRQMLVAHAYDLVVQVCAVCLMARCPDWQMAHDRLAAAGELLGAPERWREIAAVDRKVGR